MDNEVDCTCIKIDGHLDDVKWSLSPRKYHPSRGPLGIGDWTQNEHTWLHYVESGDGLLVDDDVLRSTDTRYWSIHDVQRYCLGDLHCEQVLFTYQYPNLRMPSLLGSYFWRANTSLKLPSALYLKELHRSIEHTLKNMELKQTQMDRLIVSDQLINMDRLESFKRKSFLKILSSIISFQDSLQLVSFENLCCKRLEGIRLVQTLACFAAHSLKYLFLWRFVLPNENPILINYSYITGVPPQSVPTMLVCAPSLLVLFPCFKLICFFLPIAALLGMMGVYLGGMFSYYTDVAGVRLNHFINNTSF